MDGTPLSLRCHCFMPKMTRFKREFCFRCGVRQGDDGVIECARQTNYGIESASVYKSRNVPGRRQNRRVEGSAGVTLERAVVVDDAIYCEVTLDHVLKIEENTYDLDRDDYYFLLAAGTSLKGVLHMFVVKSVRPFNYV